MGVETEIDEIISFSGLLLSMLGEIDFTGFCWVGVMGDSALGEFLTFGVLSNMLVELLNSGLLANLSLVADGEVISDLLFATTIAS